MVPETLARHTRDPSAWGSSLWSGCQRVSATRLGDEVWTFFNAGPAEQLWYHRELAGIVAANLGGDLSRELDAAVDALAAIVP